jgi:hypothetical protein
MAFPSGRGAVTALTSAGIDVAGAPIRMPNRRVCSILVVLMLAAQSVAATVCKLTCLEAEQSPKTASGAHHHAGEQSTSSDHVPNSSHIPVDRCGSAHEIQALMPESPFALTVPATDVVTVAVRPTVSDMDDMHRLSITHPPRWADESSRTTILRI